jgi:hypothetical protein
MGGLMQEGVVSVNARIPGGPVIANMEGSARGGAPGDEAVHRASAAFSPA